MQSQWAPDTDSEEIHTRDDPMVTGLRGATPVVARWTGPVSCGLPSDEGQDAGIPVLLSTTDIDVANPEHVAATICTDAVLCQLGRGKGAFFATEFRCLHGESDGH